MPWRSTPRPRCVPRALPRALLPPPPAVCWALGAAGAAWCLGSCCRAAAAPAGPAGRPARAARQTGRARSRLRWAALRVHGPQVLKLYVESGGRIPARHALPLAVTVDEYLGGVLDFTGELNRCDPAAPPSGQPVLPGAPGCAQAGGAAHMFDQGQRSTPAAAPRASRRAPWVRRLPSLQSAPVRV